MYLWPYGLAYLSCLASYCLNRNAIVATPNFVAAKNDFPRSHLHHVQYYVTDYIPAAQTNVNTFPRPSLPSEWVWERD